MLAALEDCPFLADQAPQGYRLHELVGSGTFAEVHRAVREGDQAAFALKRVFGQAGLRGLPPPACNYARELTALTAIRHGNVVGLVESFPEMRLLVLELCAADAAELLRLHAGPVPESVARDLVLQLLRGLQAIHSRGFVHRDLKPANLLLTRAGALKVADFGQARQVPEPGEGAMTHAVASRWYRAPELLYGARAYGPAVDLWAVGCILAELLGGAPLLPGETDIDQIGRVVALLGSVSLRDWPGAAALPDFHKVSFTARVAKPLGDVLPGASAPALDLLSHLLQWNPGKRWAVEDALRHPFLQGPQERRPPERGGEGSPTAAWVQACLALRRPAKSRKFSAGFVAEIEAFSF